MSEILTANEVAGILKCSVKTVYKLPKSVQLPTRYKLLEGDKGFRWSWDDIDFYMKQKQPRGQRGAE